jgi:hypothetical protein
MSPNPCDRGTFGPPLQPSPRVCGLRPCIDHRGLVVYIDDILICSATQAEHVSLVRKVLGRLLEHDLYVKAEKCMFLQQSVSFLGYRISTSGVETLP